MASVLYGLNMVPQYRMIYNHRDFALWFDCDWDIFSWTCLLEAPVISSHLASDFWMEQRVSWLVFNESKGHGPWLWFNLKGYHGSNLPCGFQVQTWGGTFWHMNYMKCRVLQAGSESENMVIPRMKPQGLTTPVGTWGLRRWFQLTWVTWTFQPSSSEYLQKTSMLGCFSQKLFIRGFPMSHNSLPIHSNYSNQWETSLAHFSWIVEPGAMSTLGSLYKPCCKTRYPPQVTACCFPRMYIYI